MDLAKPTILVTAYAVNPTKGSEDGMGWNMILQIARHQKVIAITRKNNREAIEKYLAEQTVPEAENIEFAYFDWPYWTRFWKKGGRGAMLYFYMWQLGVALWTMRQQWSFDIVHNLNFHNDWTPSFLWLTGKPFVWGPVGHHPSIPKAYLAPYGQKALWKDRLRSMTKWLFWRCSPALAMTRYRAAHIFAMNTAVIKKHGLDTRRTSVLPSVGSEAINSTRKTPSETFTVLSVGRFVPLKGFDLTIRAFANFYHQLPTASKEKAKLILVGKGPEISLLERLIEEEQLASVVQIIPWVARENLALIYQSADVFLFPSHEGAGMVVSEALSQGLPVVCLDNCGPGEFVTPNCGRKVPMGDYDTTVGLLADELAGLYTNRKFCQQLSNGALRTHRHKFLWDVKGEVFREVYQSIMANQEKKKQWSMDQVSP